MAGKFINREKASSHPLAAGGVFEGVVKSFVNGRPVVFVKQLKCTYADVNFIGNSTRTKLVKDDQVICTFIDNELSTYIFWEHTTKKQIHLSAKKSTTL